MRLALAAALLLTAAAARAAVSLTAAVSRTQVAMEDQFLLTVTVTGDSASLPQPKLPPMDAFSVFDSGRSQSLSFVNGKMSSSVVYTFALTPRSPGQHKIPAIAADGAAPTEPIEVEVLPAGSAANGPGGPMPGAPGAPAPKGGPGAAARRRRGDVFVTATVDKARVSVNEQVTLSVRFYSAVQLLGDLRYDAPSMTGFLSEDLPPVRNGMTTLDGRPYQFSEIKVALFPVSPGKLTIGPAMIHCQLARMGGAGVDDFFDRFFQMAAPQPVTVNTDPVVVSVDPLPDGKPEDFSGVVGALTAKVSADRAAVKAGEAVTLTAVVSGTGNLKTIPDPRKPDLPALRFFETEGTAAVDKKDDRVGGTKTFRMVAVPRVSGTVRVPPFSFSYFDPASRSYKRASTAEVVLNVAPGAPGAAGPAPTAPSAPGLTPIADDVRYLKTAPARSPLSAALAAAADLGPFHALPFAALAAASALAWRRRAADADPRGRRFREALARATVRLAEAAALPAAEAARAAALIDEALAGFVAD
ncbi:MAG: protein BatD, partial [Elusimicrobia bacterium]|nr:protein BatD [Elusimicrobiota bacterium]